MNSSERVREESTEGYASNEALRQSLIDIEIASLANDRIFQARIAQLQVLMDNEGKRLALLEERNNQLKEGLVNLKNKLDTIRSHQEMAQESPRPVQFVSRWVDSDQWNLSRITDCVRLHISPNPSPLLHEYCHTAGCYSERATSCPHGHVASVDSDYLNNIVGTSRTLHDTHISTRSP